MVAVLSCQIIQLFYQTAPQLTLSKVVSDLQSALLAPGLPPPVLTWDCDDIAFLDFTPGRVATAYCDDLPGQYAACLTIAAGQSPVSAAPPMSQTHRDALCKDVTDRLDLLFPSDARQTLTLDQPLTPDLMDQVVEGLFHLKADPVVASPEPPLPRDDSADARAAPRLPAGAGEMDRLMRRLSNELGARGPNVISKAIAQATRGATNGATSGAATNDVPPPSASVHSAPTPRGQAGNRAKFAVPHWPGPASGPAPDATAQQSRTKTELQAVRDALYAADQTGAAPAAGRAGTRQAIRDRVAQALAHLPTGLVSTVAGLRGDGDTLRH